MVVGINLLSLGSRLTEGSETYLRELVAHLARVDQENEYRLFVSGAGRDLVPEGAPRFRSVVCPLAAGAVQVAAEELWLPAASRRAGVAVLFCPTPAVPRLLSVPAVLLLPERPSFCPELWSTTGQRSGRWRARLRARRCRASLRRAMLRAAAFVAISEPIRREVAQLGELDPARIALAPRGVCPRFRPLGGEESVARLLERHGLHTPFVVAVGALSPYRNLDRMVEALGQMRRCSHRLPLLALAGEDRFGCRPRLERQAVSLELREQIRFLGSLPPGDLPALYSAATASLWLAACEPTSAPMIESMACGCPAICARRSHTPEGVGDAALLVDPDRPQEIAEAVWRLATLPHIREAWVARGHEHARRFDWHETARTTRDVLLAVAQGRPLPQDARTRHGMPAVVSSERVTGEGIEQV